MGCDGIVIGEEVLYPVHPVKCQYGMGFCDREIDIPERYEPEGPVPVGLAEIDCAHVPVPPEQLDARVSA